VHTKSLYTIRDCTHFPNAFIGTYSITLHVIFMYIHMQCRKRKLNDDHVDGGETTPLKNGSIVHPPGDK
jgi:hypothetical protein